MTKQWLASNNLLFNIKLGAICNHLSQKERKWRQKWPAVCPICIWYSDLQPVGEIFPPSLLGNCVIPSVLALMICLWLMGGGEMWCLPGGNMYMSEVTNYYSMSLLTPNPSLVISVCGKENSEGRMSWVEVMTGWRGEEKSNEGKYPIDSVRRGSDNVLSTYLYWSREKKSSDRLPILKPWRKQWNSEQPALLVLCLQESDPYIYCPSSYGLT